MQRLAVAAVFLALVGLVGAARADDKPNPTGTWKWSVEIGGQTRDFTLKLNLDGDKLTGVMIGQDGKETKIEDGKYKDGEVSFKITRERDGQKFVVKYKGKVQGDSLKGKIEVDLGGEPRSFDWDAKREKK
jgi:hypothetical protein